MFQVRYICEVIVCIDSASNLIFQLQEIGSQGLRGLIKNQVSRQSSLWVISLKDFV